MRVRSVLRLKLSQRSHLSLHFKNKLGILYKKYDDQGQFNIQKIKQNSKKNKNEMNQEIIKLQQVKSPQKHNEITMKRSGLKNLDRKRRNKKNQMYKLFFVIEIRF